jgi:hypothetical protein
MAQRLREPTRHGWTTIAIFAVGGGEFKRRTIEMNAASITMRGAVTP